MFRPYLEYKPKTRKWQVFSVERKKYGKFGSFFCGEKKLWISGGGPTG
jgi:hypothetical protein